MVKIIRFLGLDLSIISVNLIRKLFGKKPVFEHLRLIPKRKKDIKPEKKVISENRKKKTDYHEHEFTSSDSNDFLEDRLEDEDFPEPYYILKSDIQVIHDNQEREYNVPFRRIDDDEHIVRFIQKAPKGTQKKVAEFVAISGISFYEENINKVLSSDEYYFELEKDPESIYDRNAIKVLGIAKNGGKEESVLVGHIPKDVAKNIVKYELLKATLRMIFLPSASKNLGLRLDIWSKRGS